MAIRLLAMDLDGTVLTHDQSIHPDLPKAFDRAKQAGIQLVVATGRAFQSTQRILAPVAFKGPLICSNGSQVLTENHETIGTEYLDRETQKHILDYAIEHDLHVSAYAEDGVSTLKDSSWLAKYKLLIRGIEIPILGYEALLEKPLFKTVFICNESEVAFHRTNLLFLENEKRAQLTESAPEYLEILPANANKGNGLAKLAHHIGIDRSEIAAIGDYRNDLEMLEWVGTAGAVGNALPEVKSLARFVVKSNEEGGVAEFIDRCILLNSSGESKI